ncbi:methyltransferase family protein [Actinoplanes sp. HUAS TT8]|uniref:methyltransferase family protein n=1 Tax=Actinoplanes sp. HUAS TT8 TaxID=3447453 RepID=UPI003F5263C3
MAMDRIVATSLVSVIAHGASVLLLLAPILLGAGRGRRERAGAFLAFLVAVLGVAVLHELAGIAGWYGFAPGGLDYRGMPVDLWLAWAALWGPLPVLLSRHLPISGPGRRHQPHPGLPRRELPLPVLLSRQLSVPVTLAGLFGIDLVAMPALDPLVRLGPHWLHGELLGLALVALPAQLLGRWTATGRHLYGRATLQAIVFTGLFLWLVPMVAFTVGNGGWPDPARAVVFLPIAALLGLPTVAAVREFAVRGGGTPFPCDPPVRLVTTGPYACVANPMQVSMVAELGLLALVAHSPALGVAMVGAVLFSIVVAARQERCDLGRRHGAAWLDYRREVRSWVPRSRPYAQIVFDLQR